MKKVTTSLLVGAASLSFAAMAFAQAPQLNEIVRNDTGSDDHEFVEICGDPGTDLTAFTIVGIEGDATSATGTIDHVHALTGIIGPTGIYTVGHAAISCADELLNLSLENGGLTVLLVRGFTGAQGMDIDLDDDGVEDGPIGQVVDAVGMGRPSQGDLFGYYGAVQIGPDTGSGGTSDFDPAAIARCADCVGAWGMTCLDGTEPTDPGCDTTIYNQQYASPCLPNACGPISVDDTSWGATKALYK